MAVVADVGHVVQVADPSVRTACQQLLVGVPPVVADVGAVRAVADQRVAVRVELDAAGRLARLRLAGAGGGGPNRRVRDLVLADEPDRQGGHGGVVVAADVRAVVGDDVVAQQRRVQRHPRGHPPFLVQRQLRRVPFGAERREVRVGEPPGRPAGRRPRAARRPICGQQDLVDQRDVHPLARVAAQNERLGVECRLVRADLPVAAAAVVVERGLQMVRHDLVHQAPRVGEPVPVVAVLHPPGADDVVRAPRRGAGSTGPGP